MPPVRSTSHRTISNLSLPYISNSSVISTNPQFISGSTNILTGQLERAERRPGFNLPFLSGFTNLRRSFLWRKWAGSFFWMGCDVVGTTARVYKFEIGTDVDKVLLFTSTSAEPFDFVVSNNHVFFGNGTDMKKYDGTTITNWGIATPATGPGITLVSGTVSIFTSWCYCYTYYNSVTRHESSPSPISACSGVFASKKVRLSLTASTDTQVTGIRVYRTPDGGSQDPSLMKEITGSPFPNATGTIDDSTLDSDLSIRTAPPFFRNDPPLPQMGFIKSDNNGRIWGFKNATVYYSAAEETADPMPEECFPGGDDGNFYPWANEVMALGEDDSAIIVFQSGQLNRIEGDSLDTLRRSGVLKKRGTRNRAAVVSIGGSVAWFDTAGQVWVSDLGEVGLPIRPDTQAMDQSKVELVVHISGIYHWLVLLDGAAGRLFVFDLDNRQWMPPWTVGTTASALVSGETAPGEVNLLLARNNAKLLQLQASTYEDDATPYSSVLATNMYMLTPDNNPSWKGVHDFSEIKTDSNLPSRVEQITDDDPSQGTYLDITANGIPSPDIPQGQFLKTTRYPSNYPNALLMGMKFTWDADSQNFRIYHMTEGFHNVG